jgi:hypothetical protein
MEIKLIHLQYLISLFGRLAEKWGEVSISLGDTFFLKHERMYARMDG